jgi:hypothetical protein
VPAGSRWRRSRTCRPNHLCELPRPVLGIPRLNRFAGQTSSAERRLPWTAGQAGKSRTVVGSPATSMPNPRPEVLPGRGFGLHPARGVTCRRVHPAGSGRSPSAVCRWPRP